jgi:hypothetical protein
MDENCIVCGVSNPEHYFGTVKLPAGGTGEHVKTGEQAHGFEVVEWTGDYTKVEYWECESCFSGDAEKAQPA